MVKRLSDICFQRISSCTDEYDSALVSMTLTRHQKEELLKRMTSHQQLLPQSIQFVKDVIFSFCLRRIELSHNSYVQDSMLQHISKSTKKLEYLFIENCVNITDKGLKDLLTNQPNLFFLQLKNLPLVTGDGIRYLNSLKLQTLILRHMKRLEDFNVLQLISNCSSTQYVDLQFCQELSDSSVIGIAAILKDNLSVLKISGITRITDQSLEAIVQNCTKLKKLKISFCNRLSMKAINHSLQSLPLETVDISYCASSGKDIAEFYDVSCTLRHLNACGVQISRNVLLDLVSHCTQITSLILCGNQDLNDETVDEIVSICGENLKTLDLSYCTKITDKGIDKIVRKCIHLEKLTMQQFSGTGKPFIKYSDIELEEQSLRITHLSLPACHYFDGSIFLLIVRKMCNLVELNLAGMNMINDEILYLLAEFCPLLQYVNFKGCKKISDDGLCELVSRLPLKCITLSGIHQLTDRSVFMMASCLPNTLESVYISGCTFISPHVVQYLKDNCVKGIYVQHRIPNAPHDRIMARNLNTGEFCRMDSNIDRSYDPTI